MLEYFHGIAFVAGASLLHAPLLLVICIPFALLLGAVAAAVETTSWRSVMVPRAPRHVWLPSSPVLVMILWAPLFLQPQNVQRPASLPWTAWVIVLLFLVHLSLIAHIWWRTDPDRRPLWRLLVQLWIGFSVGLVGSLLVTPGGAIGAL